MADHTSAPASCQESRSRSRRRREHKTGLDVLRLRDRVAPISYSQRPRHALREAGGSPIRPKREPSMVLLNPRRLTRPYPDARSAEVMRKRVGFFGAKGKTRLKADYHAHVWYADFLEFVRRERIFATISTPAGYGAPDARWDTWRICEFAEILGFYGLQYWYTWQVTVLGLGPIW